MNELSKTDQLIASVGRKSTVLKWALGLGTVIVLGPLFWMLFYALVGAAAAGAVSVAIAVGGMAVSNYWPVLTMRMKNRKIAAIKEEAAANPIETMQVQYDNNERELEASRRAIDEFAAETVLYGEKIKEHKRNYPEDVDAIADMGAQFDGYNQLLDLRNHAWEESKRQQGIFERTIARMSSRLAADTAGIKARELSAIGKKDIYAKIKLEAAYDSVMRTNARAMSELRSSLAAAKAQAPALTNQPADVIDMEPLKATSKVTR